MLSRGGYDFLEKKLMEEKQKKQSEEAAQSRSIETIVDPLSPTYEAAKQITNRIVSDYHLLVINFYNNCWMSKPNLFNLLTT